MENYKKSLKGRKKGKIDLLEDQIMNLKEEQQELEGLHRDNLEDSKLLQEKLNKIKEMEHNLEQALKNKVEIKNRGLSSEEEKNFNEKFYSGDIKEAEDLLYKATEAFVLYKERNEALLTMEEEGKNLQEQLKKERRELQHYEGLQGLEEDIEKKLNSIAMEKRELEGLLQQESVLEGEIKALEGRVVYLNSEFQEVVRVLNISTEEENTILKLEEKLQNLSHTIDAAKLKDSNELKKDILKDKRNNFKFLMLAAFIMSLAIIYGLISKSLPATIIGLIGILTGIYSYSQYKKASAELKSLTKEDRSRVELLLKEKTEVEEKLNELYEKYQVESYMEVKAKLDSCRSTISTLEGIKNNIKEKEKQLESLRAIKAEEGLAKIQGYYDKIFKQCKSSDLDSFYQGLKAYKDLQLDLMRLEEQVRTKRLEIEKRAKGLRSAQEELDQLLSSFKPFDISKDKKMAYYENFIESIKEGLEKIRQGEKEESKKLNELVDSLDEEIAKLNKKISESKEVKKDIEHKIETRFNNKRELWLVEEELGQCRARIEKLKTLFEASDLASSVLEEAFQEVQSNFIPRLNKEVGHILNGLTEGKYNMVTVSPMNNYEIKVLQEESLRSIDFLSGGTFDQVYFSLRLALCNLIFKEKTLPLFFDDAFIQYDESRLYRAMKFLQDYSKEHQVVVFTCRKLPLKETINLDLLQ
ncbi:MAG TPA: hypothetical protein DGK91_03565 [Clostridium sp.]|nr:hypothetical protein [Clostridium sp.]